MRIAIPEKLRLGPFDVRVKWYKSEELRALGHFVPYVNLIQMDSELSEDVQQELFLHELIEGINHHYELGLEHPKITTLSLVLAQVIRDLPEREEG